MVSGGVNARGGEISSGGAIESGGTIARRGIIGNGGVTVNDWDNAKVIASIPNDKIKTVTVNDLISLGFEG